MIQLAERFLEFAFNILDVYRQTSDELDYRQACEKGWASIAQATMHINGSPIYNHGDFFKVATKLKNTGKIDVETALIAANDLHGAGFYRGELAVASIENTLRLIEQTIIEVKRLYPQRM